MSSVDVVAPTYVLHWPSRGVGGMEWLCIRLARALVAAGRRVAVVDQPGGFIHSQLQGDPVLRLPFAGPWRACIPHPAVVVTGLVMYFRVWRELELEASDRLLFWSLHPNSGNGLLPGVHLPGVRGGGALRRAVRAGLLTADHRQAGRIARGLHARGGLAFMDVDNLRGVSATLGFEVDGPLYIPVAVPPPPERPQREDAGPVRRWAWLGRLSRDKGRALAALGAGLQSIATGQGRRFLLDVVGDGDARPWLESRAAGWTGLDVRFHGTLLGEALDAVLAPADAGAAMGTSALELAGRGIPSLLLDEHMVDVSPERVGYRFLAESEGYSLGSVIERADDLPPRPWSLERVVERLDRPDERERERAAGERAVRERHDVAAQARLLIEAAERSTATVGALRGAGLDRPGPVRWAGQQVRRLRGDVSDT